MFDKILSCTKCLSDELQCVTIDLASAAESVVACQASLQDYRSDEMWDKIFKYASDIAELHDIDTTCLHSRRKHASRHLSESVVYQSDGSRDECTTSDNSGMNCIFQC